jgi:hypothetical protein
LVVLVFETTKVNFGTVTFTTRNAGRRLTPFYPFQAVTCAADIREAM